MNNALTMKESEEVREMRESIEEMERELAELDRDIASALKRVFGCERVTWEPTPASAVNFSFDD